MINYAVVGAGWISQQAFPARRRPVRKLAGCAIVNRRSRKGGAPRDFYGIDAVVGYDGYDALLATPRSSSLHRLAERHACRLRHSRGARRKAYSGRKAVAMSEDESLVHDRRGAQRETYF